MVSELDQHLQTLILVVGDNSLHQSRLLCSSHEYPIVAREQAVWIPWLLGSDKFLVFPLALTVAPLGMR